MHVSRFVAAAAIALAISVTGGCSDTDGSDRDAKASDMIAWSQRNPPVSAETWRGVGRLVCKPTKLDVCDNMECRPIDISAKAPITVLWEPNAGRYQRCDDAGCDSYQPHVSYNGSYAEVSLPENATMLRLTASGEYREITNLHTDTLIYRGQCTKD